MQWIIKCVTKVRNESGLRQQGRTLLDQQLYLMEIFAAAGFAPLSTEVNVWEETTQQVSICLETVSCYQLKNQISRVKNMYATNITMINLHTVKVTSNTNIFNTW